MIERAFGPKDAERGAGEDEREAKIERAFGPKDGSYTSIGNLL